MRRRGPDLEDDIEVERGAAADELMPRHLCRLPFAQRLTCTITEACEVNSGALSFMNLSGMVEWPRVGRRFSSEAAKSLSKFHNIRFANVRSSRKAD